MNIIKQTAHNECGICCLNMLINHYNHTNLDLKANLLNDCNLTEWGLSLLELEQLASKYKINLETYEITWNELINLKIYNPLILVLNKQGLYHYVVAKIKNHKIYIYDPYDGQYIIKNKDELNNWTGYICLTKSTKLNFKNIDIYQPLFKNFSWSLNLIFLLINTLEFCMSMGIGLLMSKAINLNSNAIYISNLWKLGFIFCIFIFLNQSFIFINNYFKRIYYQKNYRHYLYSFFENLNNKNYYFYKCYSKSQIFQIMNLNNHLLNFYCFYWSDLFSQIIICFATIIFLIMLNNYFVIVILIVVFIKTVLLLCNFNFDSKLQAIIIKEQINIENKLNQILDFKNNNHYFKKEQHHTNEIFNNLISLNNEQLKTEFNNNIVSFIGESSSLLFNFILLIFMWLNKSFNPSTLFLSFSILNLLTSSLENILKGWKNFYHIKPIYKQSLNFINTNNVSKNNKLTLTFPESVTWKNNSFSKNLLINASNLQNHIFISSLLKYDDPLNEIKINNISLNNYQQINLHHKLIFIDENYELEAHQTLEILNFLTSTLNVNEQVILRDINIENFHFKQLSKELKIIIILCSLLELNGYIICFNNLFKYYETQYTTKIISLLTKLNENNFLISNNCESEILTFYDNHI